MDHDELFSIKATKKGFCVGGNNRSLSIYELDKTFTPNLLIGGSSKIADIKNKNQVVSKLDQQGSSPFDSSEDKIVRIHSSSNDGIFTVATTNEIGAFNFYFLHSGLMLTYHL